MTHGDDDPRRTSIPAMEEPPTRVRASSARLPALLVIIALIGVAGAGFLGRAGPPPLAPSPAPPVAALSSVRPTVSPSPPPSISPTPRLPGSSPLSLDGSRFWLVVLREGGRTLERADLSAYPTGLEASIVVRPEWQPGRVRVRLVGRSPGGSAMRLAEVPLPAIASRSPELPVVLASGTLAPDGSRWDHSITLDGGPNVPLRVVAAVTVVPSVTR